MVDPSTSSDFPGNDTLSGVRSGIAQLSQISEHFVKVKAPDLYELCKKEPAVFLNPCLYAVVSGLCPTQYLEQSVVGHLSDDEVTRCEDLRLYSDATGVVYVPSLGYRKIKDSNGEHLVNSTFLDPAHWTRETVIHRTITLQRFSHVFLQELFSGRNARVGFDSDIPEKLSLALNVIKAVAPVYYDAVVTVTRSIVPFHSEDVNSFATTGAFGFAFINSRWGTSLPFFIDDLAHQCGHLVFTSLTVDPGPLFSVPPATPISKLVEVPDPRSIYVLLHGLYTYSTISTCLSGAIEKEVFDAQDRHEALGRLAFTLQRFQNDLLLACKLPVLTDDAKKWIRMFANCYRDICIRHAEKVRHLKMKDQPYNFSLSAFLRHN